MPAQFASDFQIIALVRALSHRLEAILLLFIQCSNICAKCNYMQSAQNPKVCTSTMLLMLISVRVERL